MSGRYFINGYHVDKDESFCWKVSEEFIHELYKLKIQNCLIFDNIESFESYKDKEGLISGAMYLVGFL